MLYARGVKPSARAKGCGKQTAAAFMPEPPAEQRLPDLHCLPFVIPLTVKPFDWLQTWEPTRHGLSTHAGHDPLVIHLALVRGVSVSIIVQLRTSSSSGKEHIKRKSCFTSLELSAAKGDSGSMFASESKTLQMQLPPNSPSPKPKSPNPPASLLVASSYWPCLA